MSHLLSTIIFRKLSIGSGRRKVKRGLVIGREEKAEKDKGSGKEGDRKDEAEKAKEVATDHQADEDQERV